MKTIRTITAALVLCSVTILPSLQPIFADGLSSAEQRALNEYPQYVRTQANSCGTTTDDLAGNSNAEKAFNFFAGKGFSATQAAGIVGNLYEESNGVNPKINQGNNGAGRGIAQWGVGGRWDTNSGDNVVDFAKTDGGDPYDLKVQLDFMWMELTTFYKPVVANVKAATTLEDATKQFMGPNILSNGHATGGYENPGVPHFDMRLKDAQLILTTYGSSDTSTGANSTDACGAIIDCVANGAGAGTGTLSQTRQNVVCLAKQELAIWQKPGVKKNQLCKKYIGGLNQSAWCEEWCADFSSWVYNEAKYPLKPDPNWRIPAVQSIMDIGKAGGKFHWHAAGGYTPKPGDLVIHKEGESHVNIVIAVNGTKITMIGGDQGGPNYGGPNSTSVVSQYTARSSNDDGISGYVSPD